MINAYVSGWKIIDYHTEALDTAIDEEIPAQNGKRLALIGFSYLAAGTAHIMSILHCGTVLGSRNTASAIAMSGQKHVFTTNAPTDPAGGAAATPDIIAYQLVDGSWEYNVVASISGSDITLTTNIAGVDAGGGLAAIAALGKVRIFGVVGDAFCFKQSLTASVKTERYDAISVLAPFKGDPLYVTIDNATAAGFLHNMIWAYINK